MIRSVLVAGAGQTAAVAARTLRRLGFDGRVTLVGAEPEPPYQRPPLSKEYLAGEVDRAGLDLLTARWCAANEVELLLGTAVTAVRGADRAVELADGSTAAADALLIATGGRPRALPGVAGDRVRYLRTVADADRLRADLRPGARVVVVGAGFIGSEVASTARARGAAVTVIERLDHPLGQVLGEETGDVCAALLRAGGVTLRTGESVVEYAETPDVAVVRTSAGRIVEGDVVVVGVGMVPNVEPLAGSGIDLDDGVLTDEYCRTNVPGVYAAGDVARAFHPLAGRPVRVEHFDNASGQGAAAAWNILGRDVPYTTPHWFWSEQFGRDLQYAGHAEGWDELVVRGSAEELDFVAFYLRKGVLKAAFGMDRGAEVSAARQLMAAGAAPDPAALRDEDTDLIDLL
ncbi:NAD(P)/FAD-dependent oxidoreductase [Nonomuraea sp. C10]|uniref:NAD(P)/FAD-dependent oxidoreductase n=1 Tax=Nonomuraea sp. C10 TaxID=2600577 RepID=UPI0011CE5307|nr:FAD-dependent oxidoreductase [Nonomuraea sp. C10]TXK42350.1 pyridine nucleotide-disulfide oxidoreductase [Nonomuraea sp. C10]